MANHIATKSNNINHYELRYYDIDEDLPPIGRNETVASKGIDAVAHSGIFYLYIFGSKYFIDFYVLFMLIFRQQQLQKRKKNTEFVVQDTNMVMV